MDIIQQQVRHITAEPLFDDNAQGCQVFSILWKRVCRNQPATIPEPFGEIKDRKIGGFFECEGKNRNIAPITDEPKWSHVCNLTGKIEGDILTGLVDRGVSCSA